MNCGHGLERVIRAQQSITPAPQGRASRSATLNKQSADKIWMLVYERGRCEGKQTTCASASGGGAESLRARAIAERSKGQQHGRDHVVSSSELMASDGRRAHLARCPRRAAAPESGAPVLLPLPLLVGIRS